MIYYICTIIARGGKCNLMKYIKSAAILLSAVLLSISGCGNINEDTENKRLRLEQPDKVSDYSSTVSTQSSVSEAKQSTSSANSKEEIITGSEKTQTEKKIIEKAVNKNPSDSNVSEPAVSEKIYLKETTDKSPVSGIHETADKEPEIISVKPNDIDYYYDVRCRKLENAGAYSPEEASKLSSDMIKIQTDALEKFGYWKRSSVWEYQDNENYSPDSYVTADLNPGKLNNIWIVDVHNPEGTLLYDSRTLKPITVSKFFGDSWQSFTEEQEIESLEYQPVQCFITFDEWSFTANVNKDGNPVTFTALYKNINPEYVNLE